MYLCVLCDVLAAVSGQAQSFVVRPTDVSVVLGQTATLHCQVAHMKGQLQWTRDGFALGQIHYHFSTGTDRAIGLQCVSVCPFRTE